MSRRGRKPHLRCPDCRMHRTLCICALLPTLSTRTRVVLLLHQLELHKPTNTGVIAARCLTNSAIVYRGRPPAAEGSPLVAETPLSTVLPPGTRAALLFPHETATPIGDWREREGARGALTLVVPDGTWRQAAHARSRVPELAALPCVTLTGARAEGSRLRRASAHPERLSTLEAVALALGVLEGPAVEEALLRVYRVMADRTLWTNGRLARGEVTGGVPAGAQSHDPLGADGPGPTRRDRRMRAAP